MSMMCGEGLLDKQENIVLAIDCGTRGIRGILFDDAGNELGKSERIFDGYYSKAFQWQEAPPEMFWHGLIEVVRELNQQDPLHCAIIQGMTVSCQRDVITVVDEKGEPLRDFISWLDRRELAEELPFDWPYALLFKMIGFTGAAKTFSKVTHANWIRIHEPEIWEKADKVVLLSTYLITKLTGQLRDSRSAIAGHLPFDTKRKQWCKAHDVKYQIIQIEPEKCVELVDSFTIIGRLTPEAAQLTGLPQGLPIVSSGTDKGCETVGVGALSPETASVSLGTQATVEISTPKYVELYPFYPSFAAVQNDAYNPEVTIYHGFWMVNWFVREFLGQLNPEVHHAILEEYLEQTAPGADGLVHQPYWGMEAFKPEARGSFIGFSEGHTKKHIYRAIVEGLGFGLLEGLEHIESKTRIPVKTIGLSGGGSRSDGVTQIMADIFNRPVYRVQTYETTGLGAAMAVFVGLGRFADIDEAGTQMVHPSKVFTPDPAKARQYSEIYHKIYKKLYGRVKPLYQAYR